MYLVREVFQTKPGKAKELVKKFKLSAAHMEKQGMKGFRIMTDIATRYWTVVAEFETEDLTEFAKEARGGGKPDPEMGKIMDFFFSFGVWDIFYYIWLKVFLNWPSSLLEDDILFLIPIPWVGPVITPVIVSITFITASLWILYQIEQGRIFTFSKMDVLLVLSGLLIILISFIWNAFTVNLLAEKDPGFPWAIFLIGEVVLITGIFKGMATKAQRH